MLEAKKLVIKMAILGIHLTESKTMHVQLQSTNEMYQSETFTMIRLI